MQKEARIYGRFSSKTQENGQSKTQQIEGAKEYAKNNGYTIRGEPYFDEAVSGKNGANQERELGRLVKEAKSGETIMFYVFDRFGRQDPIDLLHFLKHNFIQRNISILEWSTGELFTKDNWGDMSKRFSAFIKTTVSNVENERKIDRQRKNWQTKRENAEAKPLTATCPNWIKPIIVLDERGQKVTKGFELIPAHAAIVERIFDLSLKGMGNTAIVKLFNDKTRKIEPFGDSDGWHQSVVDRILKSRAVLGEFQPHEYKENRKRVPIGEPIPNYYPKIRGIDESLFNSVQYKRKQRKISGSGPHGEVVSNLFTGVCKCGFCESVMTYTQKRSNTLVCEKGRRGLDCPYVGYPYQEFETSFLNYVAELDLASVVNPKTNPNNQTVIEIEQCRANISDIESKLENLANAVEKGGNMEILVARITKNKTELDKQKQVLNDLLSKRAASSVCVVKVSELKQLIAKAQDLTAKDANETRLALRQAIRDLVTKIEVFPYEIIPLPKDPSKLTRTERREATKAGYSVTEEVQRVERCYRIHFRNEENYREIFSHPRYALSRNSKYIVAKAA